MEEKSLVNLQKKYRYIGIKISRSEREMIEIFCAKNDLTISDLVRYSLQKVINEEKKYQLNEFIEALKSKEHEK